MFRYPTVDRIGFWQYLLDSHHPSQNSISLFISMNKKEDIIKLSNGLYYDPTPGTMREIPFRHESIFWIQRSDEYRLTVEVTMENTDYKTKPWESIMFLTHRSVEYILKGALVHSNPGINVRPPPSTTWTLIFRVSFSPSASVILRD